MLVLTLSPLKKLRLDLCVAPRLFDRGITREAMMKQVELVN